MTVVGFHRAVLVRFTGIVAAGGHAVVGAERCMALGDVLGVLTVWREVPEDQALLLRKARRIERPDPRGRRLDHGARRGAPVRHVVARVSDGPPATDPSAGQ